MEDVPRNYFPPPGILRDSSSHATGRNIQIHGMDDPAYPVSMGIAIPLAAQKGALASSLGRLVLISLIGRLGCIVHLGYEVYRYTSRSGAFYSLGLDSLGNDPVSRLAGVSIAQSATLGPVIASLERFIPDVCVSSVGVVTPVGPPIGGAGGLQAAVRCDWRYGK
ncbi:uncharacterized protein N7482_005985 [Penicillium canariense]|uniref:Uncharacterized protein n=1 Tax=Penicillium canariense TaxID=189055 RepID=A0A9W9I3D5_9EURO|nr:uncharacterized protein N7482_005985 [Penicillium canariense]KAJ5167204.1 hypothetical protein N7482_005985 [Penicillium canariense]